MKNLHEKSFIQVYYGFISVHSITQKLEQNCYDFNATYTNTHQLNHLVESQEQVL